MKCYRCSVWMKLRGWSQDFHFSKFLYFCFSICKWWGNRFAAVLAVRRDHTLCKTSCIIYRQYFFCPSHVTRLLPWSTSSCSFHCCKELKLPYKLFCVFFSVLHFDTRVLFILCPWMALSHGFLHFFACFPNFF